MSGAALQYHLLAGMIDESSNWYRADWVGYNTKIMFCCSIPTDSSTLVIVISPNTTELAITGLLQPGYIY